jgi:hypothetical protein
VVAVIGAGGALAAARLAHYRGYLLGASVTLVAIGFVAAYRRPAADGRACPTRNGRWARGALWVAAAFTAVSLVAARLGG